MANIVLNEIALAESILEDKPKEFDFAYVASLLSKYYFWSGCDKKETYDKLNAFFSLNYEWYNSVLHRETIERAILWAVKHQIVNINGVPITQSEIDKIKAVASKPMQRVLFVYLCIAKFNFLVNEKTDYWVVTDDVDVFRMAHVSMNSKNRDLMLHALREYGLIGFAKAIDSLSIRVLFVDDNSKSVAYITSFDDLYSEWREINGERLIRCQECGKKVKLTGRSQKYCKECAKQVHIRKTVENRKSEKSE